MTVKDEVQPGERWEFDQEVADSFDDMLQRSIPQYDVMRRTVLDVGAAFVRPGTAVVDLGCSRGEALAGYVERFASSCSYVGVEVAEPMREAAERRFSDAVEAGVDVRVLGWDLRDRYPSEVASVTLAILTVQFVPIEHRLRLLREAFLHTRPGGAFIIVEKVLGATAAVDQVLVDVYYQRKMEAGYSQEAIDRKRLSLEGVLVPVTARMNEEMLAGAGFRQVDCIWRCLNFAGWLAVRDE